MGEERGLDAIQDNGDLAEAEAHCLRLLDVGGHFKERAKALLREIRSLQQQRSVGLAGTRGPYNRSPEI